jgi:hypothetical protein
MLPKQEFVPCFIPREPQNLEALDEMQNLAPINDMKVEDMQERNARIYLACGKGAQGTVRALRHGLPVNEMAVT